MRLAPECRRERRACGDEHVEVHGDATERRCGCETGETDDEGAPASQPIRNLAAAFQSFPQPDRPVAHRRRLAVEILRYLVIR